MLANPSVLLIEANNHEELDLALTKESDVTVGVIEVDRDLKLQLQIDGNGSGEWQCCLQGEAMGVGHCEVSQSTS